MPRPSSRLFQYEIMGMTMASDTWTKIRMVIMPLKQCLTASGTIFSFFDWRRLRALIATQAPFAKIFKQTSIEGLKSPAFLSRCKLVSVLGNMPGYFDFFKARQARIIAGTEKIAQTMLSNQLNGGVLTAPAEVSKRSMITTTLKRIVYHASNFIFSSCLIIVVCILTNNGTRYGVLYFNHNRLGDTACQ